MTLRRFALPKAPYAGTATLAVLAVLGLGIASANTEAVVADRFSAALEAKPLQQVAAADGEHLISGSEAYWLAKRRHEATDGAIEPAAWSAGPQGARMSVGDRITISNAKGDRTLEVIAVDEVAAPQAAGQPGLDQAQRKLVIKCRDLGMPESRVLTFEAPLDAGPASFKSARAL